MEDLFPIPFYLKNLWSSWEKEIFIIIINQFNIY